jgi:hypothetical protein
MRPLVFRSRAKDYQKSPGRPGEFEKKIDTVAENFKKCPGPGAEDSGKSSDRLLRIAKKERIASRQLQKKIDSAAEDKKKKDRSHPLPPNVIPTNIHQNFRRIVCDRPFF